MKGFALTYWFTWGLLLSAAALTGVASVKDAFFGGLIAAVPSAALHRVYLRIGPRFAPVFGAAVGTAWAVVMFLKVRWFGSPEELAFASWYLGTDIAVHAAGFGGAALFTALFARGGWLAFAAGFSLSAAMSAVPSGVIAAIARQVAGPVAGLLLVSAELPPSEAPAPLPGARAAVLTAEESALLRGHYLVTEGPTGPLVQDDLGRRYWPLWRRSFVYPGNPGGPVRRLILLLPAGAPAARPWMVPAGAEPDGRTVAQLGPGGVVTVQPVSSSRQSVQVDVSHRADGLTFELVRRSPVGDLYATIKEGPFPADFPAAAVQPAEARPRPKFDAGR
ncbi:MAG: hypothetical protein ACK467_07355 [Opitutia bacterium]